MTNSTEAPDQGLINTGLTPAEQVGAIGGTLAAISAIIGLCFVAYNRYTKERKIPVTEEQKDSLRSKSNIVVNLANTNFNLLKSLQDSFNPDTLKEFQISFNDDIVYGRKVGGQLKKGLYVVRPVIDEGESAPKKPKSMTTLDNTIKKQLLIYKKIEEKYKKRFGGLPQEYESLFKKHLIEAGIEQETPSPAEQTIARVASTPPQSPTPAATNAISDGSLDPNKARAAQVSMV